MKTAGVIGAMCALSVLLAACGDPIQSVEYYKEHEAERHAVLEKCKADPDLIAKDANCRNAGSAQARSAGNINATEPKSWGVNDL